MNFKKCKWQKGSAAHRQGYNPANTMELIPICTNTKVLMGAYGEDTMNTHADITSILVCLGCPFREEEP